MTSDRDPTITHLAAKLLRDAAVFFENVGQQNPTLADQMADNAEVYRQVADLIEADPGMQLSLSEPN